MWIYLRGVRNSGNGTTTKDGGALWRHTCGVRSNGNGTITKECTVHFNGFSIVYYENRTFAVFFSGGGFF